MLSEESLTKDNIKTYSNEFCFEVDCLARKLQECRLSNKFTDIIIKVGDRQFPAHRVVLANSGLGGVSFDDPSQTVYELDEKFVKPDIVEELLTFLYTHKITFRVDNLKPILIASSHLKIELLLSACDQFFIKIFHFGNISDWFSLSILHRLDNFKNYCFEHIFENIKELNFRKKLYKLSAEDFHVLLCELSSKDTNDTINGKFLLTIIGWVKQDFLNRKSSLSKLLRKIKWTENPFILFCSQILSTSHPCSGFLVKALRRIMNYSELLYFIPNPQPNTEKCFTTDPDHVHRLDNAFIGSRLIQIETIQQCEAVVDRKVYFFGGKKEDHVTNETRMIDFSNETTRELKSMPYNSQRCAAAVCNGFIYVTRGSDETDHFSKAFRYDIQTNKWTMIKPMKYARWGHQLISVNGRLYAIGGCFFVPDQNSNMRQSFRRKLTANFEKLTNLRFGDIQYYHGNDYKNIETAALRKVEEYNLSTNEWRTVASCHYYHTNLSATVHRGKIYVCSDSGFEAYSPEWNRWKKLATFDKTKEIFTMKSIGGKLYIFAPEIYSYDVEKDRWNNEVLYMLLSDIAFSPCPLISW